MTTRLTKAVEHGSSAFVRRAFTLLELSVAAAMLAVLMVSGIQMIRLTSTHQRAAERRVIALEAVQAVADKVGNTPWDKLTSQVAKQATIAKLLQPYLPGATLSVALNDETAPAASKRLHVELAWRGADGQPVAPVRLTTWIFPEQAPVK